MTRLDIPPVTGGRDLTRVSRRAALCALGVATLAACGPGTTADLSATDNAVEAASVRVVRVVESSWEVDGLGHAISMTLRVEGATPMSAGDLDAIVEAIWLSTPGEPNGLNLMAFADDAEEEPVDLRAAAKELTPTYSAGFGEGGISMTGMQKRYGDWDGREGQ